MKGIFHHIKGKPGQITRQMPIGRGRAGKASETCLIFRARTFCLLKKKKQLDLQVFNRKDRTMKKLQ